jgi:uncharacterized protein (TIGR02284 family)
MSPAVRALAFGLLAHAANGRNGKGVGDVTNEKAVSTLNALIETLKDGEVGFRTAAEGLTDPQVKALFQQYARERSEMAHELQVEVQKLGGDPERAGSLSGSAHRGWINIKSAVTGKDDASIVAEAERGEDIAKKAFEDASVASLPPSARAVVTRLTGRVREAHDRVRSMERSQAYS